MTLIIGIGTDIFEISRIKKAMDKDPSFIKTVFTKDEIQYCEKLKKKEQNYAARYAAKEAFMKALGTGWRDGIKFTDINIVNNILGKPEIMLEGKAKEIAKKMGSGNIHLSMSHITDIASAFVVIENDK